MNELEEQRLRFYRLANGLMAIVYIAFICWLLAQAYNILF